MPDLAEVYRDEVGRCTATLIRVLGDIDLAEEAVAEAFAIAAEQWPTKGVPPNPGGWITTTARNRAIDRLRRGATRGGRPPPAPPPPGDDDMGKTHPALHQLHDFLHLGARQQPPPMFPSCP